jgi:hypothetical protein
MAVAIFISVLLLLGLAMLAWCIQCIIRGRQSLLWPTAPGRILECRMESDGDGEMPSMKVRVRYDYEVGGQHFEGNRVAYGYCGGTLQAEHQRLYDELRPDSQVMVHYQPGHPARSVLVPGIHRLTFVVLTFAIILVLAMSGALLVWCLPSRQEPVLRKENAMGHDRE